MSQTLSFDGIPECTGRIDVKPISGGYEWLFEKEERIVPKPHVENVFDESQKDRSVGRRLHLLKEEIGEWIGVREMKKPGSGKDEYTAIGAEPHPTRAVFIHGADDGTGEPACAVDSHEFSIPVLEQPSAVRPHPKMVRPILVDIRDRRIESGRIRRGECGHTNAIEPCESVPGAKPEISVVCLGNASDGTLGQTVLDAPLPDGVLRAQMGRHPK